MSFSIHESSAFKSLAEIDGRGSKGWCESRSFTRFCSEESKPTHLSIFLALLRRSEYESDDCCRLVVPCYLLSSIFRFKTVADKFEI